MSLLVLLSLCVLGQAAVSPDCGETSITAASSDAVGRVKSPNNPGHYGNLNQCVWRITAPNFHSIVLTLPAFAGETSGCRDFLEVRDGSRTDAVLLKQCVSTTQSHTVVSKHRYLWMRFLSNYAITNSGFSASWSLRKTNVSSPALGDAGCRSTEWQCGNLQCANYSDLCDGYPDCGCGLNATGCDEDPWRCSKVQPLDSHWRLIIGLAVGIAVFFLIAVLVWCSDTGVFVRMSERLAERCAKKENEKVVEVFPMHEGEDNTGRRVTIMVSPGDQRRPRYSIFTFDQALLASPRMSAYLAAPSGDKDSLMRDPGELLAPTGGTPAFGLYGTVPPRGGKARRGGRTPRREAETGKKLNSNGALSPRSPERQKKRRADGTIEPPPPVFRQIARPSFPVPKYI